MGLESAYNQIIIDFKGKIEDIEKVMPYVAAVIRVAIEQNFASRGRYDGIGTGLFSGGDKKWLPLAPSTQKKYKKLGYLLEPTLERTGYLKSQIEVRTEGSKVIISVGGKYSAIHQLGGKRIKPRPYLTLTQSDLDDIVELIKGIIE